MSWAGAAAPVVYAAGATLMLLATRRVLRPTRMSRGAAVALGCLPLLFVGPALVTGRVYAPFNLSYSSEPLSTLASAYGLDDLERYPRRGILTDVNSTMLPWRAAVRHSWALGEWPLWNPFMLAGDPLAGSAQSAPYDPIHLWSLLLPLVAGWTPAAGLRFLLNALGMFLLLRRFACRESVAVAGAAAWTFSTFCAFWHAWPLGATLGLLPLLVETVERLIEKPGRRSAVQLGAVLVTAILAGHPESLVHLVTSAGLWGAMRLFSGPASWAQRASTLAFALAAGLIAAGATAFFLLPFLDVLEQTASWRMRAAAGAALNQSATWGAAAQAVVRTLLPPIEAPATTWLGDQTLSGYAGSLLWAPATFALLWGRARREVVLACGALGLLGVLLAAHAPGLTDAVGFVPLVNRTLADRFVVLVPFALVVLAALGLEAWRDAPPSPRWAASHWTCLTVAALTTWIVSAQLPATGADRARAAVAAGWMLGVLLAAALLASWLGRRRRLALLGFVGLLFIQRFGEFGSFYPRLPAAAFFPRPSFLEHLPAAAEPYRVVGANWAMVPNTSVHWNLEDPRGYQPTKLWRFAAIEPFWANPQEAWFNRVDDLRSPWLRFLNVQYAITGWAAPPAGWREIARSEPKGARLLRSARSQPRAFLPERLRFVDAGTRGEALAELQAAPDLGDLAWIETAETVPGKREVRNAKGRVGIERRGTGYRLTTRLNRPGWVAVSVTAWRGWRATDLRSGRELPVGFANHAFLAVPVDGGRRTIELRYSPASFRWGLLVSVSTLLALVLLAVPLAPTK